MSKLPPVDKLQAGLLATAPQEYGEKYRDHLIEQYKVYLELTDRISGRRQEANTFYLTINTALVTVAGFLASLSGCRWVWPIGIALAGMVLCFTWYRLIRSYRDLNSIKLLVVQAFERILPAKPYETEWEAVGRGANAKLYLPFTHVEMRVPWVFFSLYCLLLALCAVRAIWPGLV